MSPKRGIPIRDGADRSKIIWAAPASYGIESGRYYSYPSTFTTYTPADTTSFLPFVVHTDMEVSGLAIFVEIPQASGLLRLGLYASDDTIGLYPGILVEDLGTIDASTGGGKDIAFSANRVWIAGEVWWFALQTSDVTIAIRGTKETLTGLPLMTIAGNYMPRDSTNYASGLPDPASATTQNAVSPGILVKIA